MRHSPRLRQVAIQLRKRVPWDVSELLGIEPYVMAKTLGCHLSATCRAAFVGGLFDESVAESIVDRLGTVDGCLGEGAWGYEFDVQTRWAYYPAGSPNLIATVFVGRAFALASRLFERGDWGTAAVASADYACSHLLRDSGRGARAFYYTPDTEHLVHNANLLGAALCASTVPFRRGESAAVSLEAAGVTIEAQHADGSWVYGDAPGLGWVDSFHTAYNLDGLLQVWLLTGDDDVYRSLSKGCEYWTSRFFGPSGEPRYHHDGSGGYDIHAAATAVDVGSRLASWGFVDGGLPRAVSTWTKANLVDPLTGATYNRISRFGVDRRRFARWGDAHWALGRASLLLLDAGLRDPLETAIREARE